MTHTLERALESNPAWLGYKAEGGQMFARVCAWCPPAKVKAAEEWAKPLPVSHGCCPDCAQRMMAQVTGENPATQESACTPQ